MKERIFFNPLWGKIRKDILGRNSVLIHAPNNYGKNFFYKSIYRDKKIKERFNIATLILPDDTVELLDYQEIFNKISEQIGLPIKNEPTTRIAFIPLFIKLIKRKKLLLILRVNQQNKGNTSTLINILNEIISDGDNYFYCNFSVLVIDDYSLCYHELEIKENFSKWDFLERYSFTQFSDVSYVITFFSGYLPQGFEKRCAKILLDITGGNDGLIIETFDFLRSLHKPVVFEKFESSIKNNLLTSDIIVKLQKYLLDASGSSINLMLEYNHKKLLPNEPSADLIELIQMGIVLKTDSQYAALCGGIISEIIKKINETKKVTISPDEKEILAVQNRQIPRTEIKPAGKILVLAAIDEEFNAFKMLLTKSPLAKKTGERSFDDTNYIQWNLSTGGYLYEVCLFKSGKRNNNVNSLTSKLIVEFTPAYIFFMGTAGSLIPEKAKIGDIIIPAAIINYQHENVYESNRYNTDDNFMSPSRTISGIARTIKNDSKFIRNLQRLKVKGFKNDYSVFDNKDDSIMSGDKTIYEYNVPEVVKIKNTHPRALAIEQEGYGFLSACQGRAGIEYLVIRSISDYLKGKDDDNKKGSRPLASRNAALFIFELLKKLQWKQETKST